jgi:DNA replication factor GINS
MSISELAKVYSIGYMTEEVKVRFKKDVKVNIFNISVDAKENDTQTVPRWLANILQENGLAEVQGQDMGVDLLRALSRERIAGSEQLSALKSDFYIRLHDFIRNKTGMEREKLNVSMQDIVLLRLSKITHFARSAPLTPDLEQKLTYEEKTLFQLIHKASKDFKECVLGGKQ